MPAANVFVATIPGMISDSDLDPIRKYATVNYCEFDHLEDIDLAKKCCGQDVLMLNYDVVKKLSPKFYQHKCVRRLKTISTDITGMDWSNPAAAKDHGVKLQHIPHYSTESVAETVLCEVLLHSRKRLASFKDMIKGRDVEGRKGINLLGKNAGVIGYGSIGARVATLLSAVGMSVSIWNRTPKLGVATVSIEQIFATSQVICLCVATEMNGLSTNKGMVNEQLLQLAEGTIIINLAGEFLVDNLAMIEAVKSGKVVGYTVERSPTTLSSGLAKLDEVHLPPKNAWYSQESLDELRRVWVANTISALQGKPTNLFEIP